MNAIIVLDESTLERYVGTYALTPTFAMTVSREKNEMYLDGAEIFALAQDEFFCEGGRAPVIQNERFGHRNRTHRAPRRKRSPSGT